MIKEELEHFLDLRTKQSTLKSRNISLVMYYLGFDGEISPSLEDCAKKFNVGDQENPARKAERPRQIINKLFWSKACIEDFPSLSLLDEYLQITPFVTDGEYYEYCVKNNITDMTVHPLSLLRILSEFKKIDGYGIYTSQLDELTRFKARFGDEFYIAKNEHIASYLNAIQEAKKIPGAIGIAKVSYIEEIARSNNLDIKLMLRIMKLDVDSWFGKINGEEYYLFENRDNMLINYLEKIASVTKGDEVYKLASVIVNASKSRTAKRGEYPVQDVVEHYLKSSRFTIVNDDYIELNIEPKKLNEIEELIVHYMESSKTYDPKEVRDYLEQTTGYKSVYINKSTYGSPLIYVDKTKGRKNYRCSLIGSENKNFVINRYESFKQKLLELSKYGTDIDIDAKARKEQKVLRSWLFDNKLHAKCAICNSNYSVGALVAAHKKKRSLCSENERTDPYIVMPLCVFGCDNLYERKLVRIRNSKFIACDFEQVLLDSIEYQYLTKLDGGKIDNQWGEGNSEYFE